MSNPLLLLHQVKNHPRDGCAIITVRKMPVDYDYWRRQWTKQRR